MGKEELDQNAICRLMFQSAAEGMLVTNRAGEILMANPRTFELFGYEEEELLGENISVLIPHSVRDKHVRHQADYFHDPRPRAMGTGMYLMGLKKDNTEIPLEISLNHFVADDEHYGMALITDISERVTAQQELENLNKNLEAQVTQRSRKLKQSEKLYSTIARNYPNGTISVLDSNMNYLFIEGQGLYSLGITSEKLIGTSYRQRLPGLVAAEIIARLEKVFAGNNTHFEVEKGDATYHLNAVGMQNDEGKVDRILIVEQNITERKLAERKVFESLAREKELNEFKSRFVSMASHEFRTPLATILSSTNLLSRYHAPEHEEKRTKHIQRIVNSVQNLTSILNDFLSLSKLEEGKVETALTQFDLVEWAEDIMDEMQNMTKAGQTIHLEHIGKKHNVTLDRNILRNIAINLLSNAIKYSNEGSNIWFTTEFDDQYMEIRVRDEGIGIPEDEQAHMFERFFRANNVTNIQGTGLGLHIVKRYVDLLDGTISFTSEQGHGTEFRISIPQNY